MFIFVCAVPFFQVIFFNERNLENYETYKRQYALPDNKSGSL
jgi:hypothetical protein